jgi:hypothetical protein
MYAIIFFGYCNVYKMKEMRRLEFYNEFSIMLCIYHSFLFTDYVDDPLIRYTMGYSLICITLVNLGGNLVIMTIGTMQKVFGLLKRMKQKFRRWRHIR